VNAADVRRLIAELPDATEGAHHGHPDFRVRKGIFATLSEAEDRAALRLSAAEARALAVQDSRVYRLVSERDPIGWVSVLLEAADVETFGDLLEAAWRLRSAG
jgi:hypothetical protein